MPRNYKQICKRAREKGDEPIISHFCEIRDSAQAGISQIIDYPEAIDTKQELEGYVENIKEETKKIEDHF